MSGTDHALHVAERHSHRSDIDGLRALAVLPILFNHVGVRGFGGGYIGVDIFFVISGFLITGILVRDIQAKRHSIAEFYRRRILRIFPALFAMLAIVMPLAMLALLPGELARFAQSVGGTALFGSNFVFFFEAGYFDNASRVKPLLHTWSLAIEEQFYILWPLLMAAIGAAHRRRLVLAMALVAIASFAIAVWLVLMAPSAAFYLLPARAWELAVGGLLALRPMLFASRPLREAVAAIGLLAILGAIWRFSAGTPFPGAAALVPCLATVALIGTGPDTMVARLLSVRPAVFVGLISYSLYLWHWPVIVFAEVWLLLSPSPALMAAEILVATLLAIASWRWIETPFRIGGRRWSTRGVLIGGGAAIAAALVLSGALIASGGLPARFTPEAQALARWKDGDFEASYRRGTCFVTSPTGALAPQCVTPAHDTRPVVLLVGDSMAAHLWPGLSRYRDRYDILQATIPGCRPGIYPSPRRRCEIFFHDMFARQVVEIRPAVLVLGGRWQAFDLPSLNGTLAWLREHGISVVLVGSPPAYHQDLPRLLALAEQRGQPSLVWKGVEQESVAIDPRLARIARDNGAAYVSLVQSWCGPTGCRTMAAGDTPLQFDYGHFTPEGSAVAARLIVPAIQAQVR